MNNYFDNKSILITGASGSIGSALVNFLRQKKCKVIRALSNDENGLYELSELINEEKKVPFNLKMKKNKIRFIIGDVRDYARCVEATSKIDIIIHAAALKHVPLCEYNPREANKTNITGTKNLIKAAIKNKVKKFLFISTDKVVDPISVMGKSKLKAEKLVLNTKIKNNKNKTIFSCIRFGNIIGSRGSVLPKFKKQIFENKNISLTSKEMNRYFLTIDNAVKNICSSIELMKGKEIFVINNLPIFNILDLAEVLVKYYRKKFGYNKKILVTGARSGERMTEELFIKKKYNNIFHYKNLIIINDSINPSYVKKYYNLDNIKIYKEKNKKNVANQKFILVYMRKNNLL
mgnify:FL=1